MAKHGFFRAILLTFCFALLAFQQGYAKLQIVEPYPKNIYPIEGTDAEVTCTAFDSEGLHNPVRIDFMRKDDFGQYTNLSGQEPHFSFVARTESNGWRMITTLHIKNVTENDDDEKGGKYECWAHKAGEINKNTAARGFSVTVILKRYIPVIKVTPDVIADPNDKISLSCNVTYEGSEGETELKRISWTKDGKTLEEVRHPDPADPTATLRPFTIDSARPQLDSGIYTCILTVRLLKTTDVDITRSITISVKPGFVGDISNKVLEIKKGNSVQFPCAAVGDPLLLEWRRQAKRDEHGRCISDSDDRYNISRKDVNSNYILTINTVSYDDEGKYFCCFPTNCSENTKCCQEWTLLVYDLSGPCPPGDAAMLWKPQNIFVCLSVVITVRIFKLFP